MVQNDNDIKLWTNVRSYLAFKEIESPMITTDIKTICKKLSFGYTSRMEKRFLIVIPNVVKQLVGNYVFEKPCIYLGVYLDQETGKPFEPPVDSPTALKIKWKRKYWDTEQKLNK